MGLSEYTSLSQIYGILLSFIPVTIYPNTDTDKLQILADNKDKAGIYLWTHKESGKQYVGSSINLRNRFRSYYSINYLNHIKNRNMIITKVLLKYGYSAFSLSILEYINITGLSKEEQKKLILGREQYYLDLMKSEDYNVLKTAGSTLGFKHREESLLKISKAKTGSIHTEETKTKMSINKAGSRNPFYGKTHSLESRIKLSIARKGVTHTEESKAKIRLTKIGENHPMFGKNHTIETREKISQTKSIKVYLYTKDPISLEITLFKSFNNYTEVTKFFDCSKRTISNYVDKNKLYKKKWLLYTSVLNND